mmetsp:Transcript_33825/g.100396  ORF Transcript_33825/g.100396 Transcript_33825/m.100396 type:complete len:205 (+) Transcript_33825:717-1331(+)
MHGVMRHLARGGRSGCRREKCLALDARPREGEMGRGRRSEIVCEIVCKIECAAHLMRRVRRLEREAAQVGHQPLRVAGWCPAHLRVPEEFDHMGLPRQRRPEIRPRARPRGGRAVRACPRDVERDVKGGEGEAEREDLKADQVRGQDRGRFNEGELVRLVGDEVAMLLARLCVVRRVDEAVERPVDVAAAVKGVEAEVQSDVEE